jgi:predicted nucleic acid-binding protein
MATYTVDAVAMLRYLVDELPGAANEVFERAEQGIDFLSAPDVQLAEVLFQVSGGGVIAGVELAGEPNDVLRRLVTSGPVEVAPIGEHELAVFASEIDRYSMHDGLLVATHRVHGTDAIVTKDRELAGESTVWD